MNCRLPGAARRGVGKAGFSGGYDRYPRIGRAEKNGEKGGIKKERWEKQKAATVKCLCFCAPQAGPGASPRAAGVCMVL